MNLRLPDLLQLGRVGLELPLITHRKRIAPNESNIRADVPGERNNRIRIGVMKRVVEMRAKEERVHARLPFVMKTEEHVRLLPLLAAESLARRWRANPRICG